MRLNSLYRINLVESIMIYQGLLISNLNVKYYIWIFYVFMN